MESIPQPVIKLGLKIFIDTGEVLIQLGEKLIPYSSLPAGLQGAIEAVLEGSTKAITGAAMNPVMLVGFAFFGLLSEYRRARSDQREQEANQRAEQANQQAREAEHQAEEAHQQAREAYHQAEAAHQRAREHEQEVREAREELERYASSRILCNRNTNGDHRRYIRGVEIAVQISAEDIPDLRRQCELGEIEITQNIAVVGRVSSGKTTFINDCRGLRFSQVGPRERGKEYQLGEVGNEETTQHRQLYRDIEHEQIFWWDMPGIGGQSQREWNYYTTFNLSLYDRLLILHDKPFSQVS